MDLTYSFPDGRVVAIREFLPADSLAELTCFLHRGYRSLAEMGFRYFASYQTEDETMRRISGARCLVATLDGTIAGAITFRGPQSNSRCAWFNRPDVASFGQFAVEPSLRNSGLGGFLLSQMETLASRAGMRELALDTAEGATHLINFYEKRGFRFIEYVQWDVTNYRSVVMSKTLIGN